MKVSDALDAYTLQLQADGRSPHTVAQAKRHLRLFIASVGDGPVADVRPEDVARFLASDAVTRTADGRPRKPTSANALRSTLRCFFSYAHAAGLVPANAARLVRRARCGQSCPKALTDSEVGRLLGALEQARTPAEQRDRVIFTVLLRSGLRVGTAVALDVEDLDFEAGELRLRKLKGGGEDVAYLPADVVALLRVHVGPRTSGPLFTGSAGGRICARQVARRLERVARDAGIERAVSPHMLRHTLATTIFRTTSNLLLVAQVLHHRTIASTQVYLRVDAAAVRAAVGASAVGWQIGADARRAGLLQDQRC